MSSGGTACGKALVDGSGSIRAEAAAHVIRSIAERAGTGEDRDAPRTAEERAQSAKKEAAGSLPPPPVVRVRRGPKPG